MSEEKPVPVLAQPAVAGKKGKKSNKGRKRSPKAAKPKANAGGGRRGPRLFPKATLAKALEVAQALKEKNGGEPWDPAQVAEAISMGAHAPAFYYVTAAARDFGLTIGTRDTPTIALDVLGREIVYAANSEEEQAKKLEAFQRIDLFHKVLLHYKGANLPELKYLGNTLESKFGLPASQHEEFSRLFRENCKYLGITEGEGIPAGAGEASPTKVLVGEAKKTSPKAFVIMPFTEKSPERVKGFFNEVLKSLITPAGVKAGFNVETANRQGSDIIQSTIVNDLLDADLVIADLTDHNPNVLFELGLRIAEKKAVALIKAVGTGKVFDVDNMMRVVEYQPQLWPSTVDEDIPTLTAHFQAAWENRGKNKSYMEILRTGREKT